MTNDRAIDDLAITVTVFGADGTYVIMHAPHHARPGASAATKLYCNSIVMPEVKIPLRYYISETLWL